MEKNKQENPEQIVIDKEHIMSLVADNDGVTRIPEEEEKPDEKATPQADEPETINSEIKKPSENSEPSKENRKRKSRTLVEYETAFLRPSTMMAKGGKTVYIRPEHHARMARVINTIGRNNLSITDYLDNVLEQHFKDYESDINNSFRENFKSII